MEKTSTMKQARTSVLVALALICVVSCAKIDDESSAVAPEQPARPTVLLPTRSYEEALSLARKSIALVDRGQTRSATARSIRSERGQCVTTPSTRSGAGSDTLMYVFNFERTTTDFRSLPPTAPSILCWLSPKRETTPTANRPAWRISISIWTPWRKVCP